MSVPYEHRKTTTFLAALGTEGMFAPAVIDGTLNGDLFVIYIEHFLVLQLRSGQVVVNGQPPLPPQG